MLSALRLKRALGVARMLHGMFLGFFFFGMAVFLILLGLWAWMGASEAEEEGEPVELHSLGQATYREPWFQKFGAAICFIFGAGMIVLGILALQ
jgi:uncharacterized membrane protein YidH (DUF202 family)